MPPAASTRNSKAISACAVEGALLAAYSFLLPTLWELSPDESMIVSALGLAASVDMAMMPAVTIAMRFVSFVPMLLFLLLDFGERACGVLGLFGHDCGALPTGMLRVRNALSWFASTLLCVALVAPTGMAAAQGVAKQLELGDGIVPTIVLTCDLVALGAGLFASFMFCSRTSAKTRAGVPERSAAACSAVSGMAALVGPLVMGVLVLLVAFLMMGVLMIVMAVVRFVIWLIGVLVVLWLLSRVRIVYHI